MTLRTKLPIVFTVTLVAAIGVFAWGVIHSVNERFGQLADQRSGFLVGQFQREFAQRGNEVIAEVQGIAETEGTVRMALDLSRPQTDASLYANDATGLASDHHLDFLELANDDGTILSSSQWPARVGYKNDWVTLQKTWNDQGAFLGRVELPDTVQIGVLAVRAVHVGDRNLYVIGGRQLNRDFLRSVTLPVGTRALLYLNLEQAFVPGALVSADGPVTDPGRFAPLVESLQTHASTIATAVDADATGEALGYPAAMSQATPQGSPQDALRQTFTSGVLSAIKGRDAGAERFVTLPLLGRKNELLGALLVGSSQGELAALLGDIHALGLGVAGLGIVFGIALSLWVSRVTRPLRRTAEALSAVARGDWNAHVPAGSRDEFGGLARAFNDMTRHLANERERMVQAERVAAWREVTRRLANEVKEPLFPLQITLENMIQERERDPRQFAEVFAESTATMRSELENLRSIVARFSDFAKMPSPRLQRVNVNDVLRTAVKAFEPQFSAIGRPPISTELYFDERISAVKGDPEWLHRSFEILLLLAIDAMPGGGTLTIRTAQKNDVLRLAISDTGGGPKADGAGRLFIGYDGSKQHRDGGCLGLATVQAVVSDHQGRIFVESTPGVGTTYRTEFPVAVEAVLPVRSRAVIDAGIGAETDAEIDAEIGAKIDAAVNAVVRDVEASRIRAEIPIATTLREPVAPEQSIQEPVAPEPIEVAPVLSPVVPATAPDAATPSEDHSREAGARTSDVEPAHYEPQRELVETRRQSTSPRLFNW